MCSRIIRVHNMALLLGYSLAFLVVLGIVAWIVFPRLMRALFVALLVLLGVSWIVGSMDQTTPPGSRENRK
jgi:hypothetical protein